jgi:ankyrin repeat protein
MLRKRILELAAAAALLLTVLSAAVGLYWWRENQRRLNKGLADAVEGLDLSAVRAFVHQGADVRTVTEVGGTALHRAAAHGDAVLVEEILDRGAPPDLRSAAETTALMSADPACARLLLERGADVHATDYAGRTVLHHAVYRPDTLRLLVRHGGKLEAKDRAGRTPLLVAAWNGQGPAVRALLALGADPEAVDPEGSTTLELALRGAHQYRHGRPDLRRRLEAIRLLEQALERDGRSGQAAVSAR